MKTTVNKYEFCEMFREIRPDNFSYNGLNALFEYLEYYENETDTEIELDVIAICCEFSEYESAVDCVKTCGYNVEFDGDEFGDSDEEKALEWLQEETLVHTFDGGIIIQDF